jgi:putative intracellular protease/amidase
MNRLGTTLTPTDIKSDDYVAIYYTGGHGVIWDFPDNEILQTLSRKIYEKGGFVSSVCHGALGLLNIQLLDGTLLIKGKNVTGFSNEEEKLVELYKVVPFLTETELAKRGAMYQKADKPWGTFALEDSRLITGQNPASGGAVADLLIAALRKSGP